MKTTANIATYPPRLESLKRMLKSIYHQFHLIRIYFNEYDKFPLLDDPDKKIQRIKGENLTDNGKFIGIDILKKHEYYFTLDDDLIYPRDYVRKTIEAIEKYGCIVTYHGRKLLAKNTMYYYSHRSYHCLLDVEVNIVLDVCGTGVTAFRTDYFMPVGLHSHPEQKMSDLIFSLEAAKKNKIIGLIEHKQGWIKPIENEETIYKTEVETDQSRQNKVANQIYELRYENRVISHTN